MLKMLIEIIILISALSLIGIILINTIAGGDTFSGVEPVFLVMSMACLVWVYSGT